MRPLGRGSEDNFYRATTIFLTLIACQFFGKWSITKKDCNEVKVNMKFQRPSVFLVILTHKTTESRDRWKHYSFDDNKGGGVSDRRKYSEVWYDVKRRKKFQLTRTLRRRSLWNWETFQEILTALSIKSLRRETLQENMTSQEKEPPRPETKERKGRFKQTDSKSLQMGDN